MLSLAFAPLLATSALAAVPRAYGDAPPVYSTGAPPSYGSGASTASAAAPTSTFPAATGNADHFRLYVNVTGTGSLEGPYSAEDIVGTPAQAYTCSQSPGATDYCCSMPIIFSTGYNPYSSNPSDYDFTPSSNASGAPLEIRADSTAYWHTDYFHIASTAKADEQGRRPVRQTYCEGDKATPGVSVASQPAAHLVYDEPGASFGSFYVCWVEYNVFGPSLFYRSEDQAVPAGCADATLLVGCSSARLESTQTGNPQDVQCYDSVSFLY